MHKAIEITKVIPEKDSIKYENECPQVANQ